jgi:AsmA protein
MAKTKRSLLRFFILSLLLFIIPVAIAPFLPLGSLKPAVENRLSELLSRRVSVGAIRLSLFGGPYLYINEMTVKEDPAFGEGNFLQANQVRADFSILSFVLRRQVELDSLTIQSPDVTFKKNPAGAWSWTTLGTPAAPASAKTAYPERINFRHPLALLMQSLRDANFRKVSVEQASVTFIDPANVQSPETLYRNVGLQAVIDRQGNSSHVTGSLRAQSEESNGADLLRAEMPFKLTIDKTQASGLAVQGSLGPGAIESKNFSAENFQSHLDVKNNLAKLEQMEMSLYEGSMRGQLQLNLATQQFTAEGEVQNLNVDQALASKLQMSGQITGHINAQFKLAGQMRAFQETVPTIIGDGRVVSQRLFIASVNLSEQVARALQLGQIGDMNQGTELGAVEANFHIEQGIVTTSQVQIQQLDGLGDATSEQGWFKVGSAPTFNYAASVLLSNDATARVKTTSPLIGAAVSLLEVNNRIAVPVSITGEVRNPQVVVDVRKFILGF